MTSPFRVNHMPGGTLRVLRDHRTVAFVKPRQAKAGELDEIADLLIGEPAPPAEGGGL